ncbi:hypothetical protein G4Y79_13465 [Phototrophicus methaneseepsis]|uniref:Membrane protein 6-pyruvoyl-tetrahydropterin synthase-related domain-containing protein n=1 Tax=Phototrophicus methaneseepsis TaxID=2710758 RepID=A0A7S8E5H3_9CHLR|nr:hypothetical protein [Phototrophicus methaneseepsis]QPC80720.1 hypothetical protein G4Y79_13465 [Phototrophicus methaneseepsis]
MMSTVPVIPKHEQPDWMRRASRGTDWGVLLALLFGLAVAWPFVRYPTLPIQNGSERAVYRTWETAESLSEGRLYPRWSAYSADGYGAPIPEFYPPGATYAAAMIQLFITEDASQAVRIIYIMAICLASMGMYSFVMKQSNAAAGLLAALLYVSSPYLGLTAPYALGDLSACVAMALLPGFLWAISRLYKQNEPYDQIIVIGLSAALLLTEPRYAMAALVLSIPLSFNTTPQRLKAAIGALSIGALLAAFYWLPALSEYNAVYWVAQSPTFERPPLNLGNLLAPLIQVDPAFLLIQPQMTLGWALILCNILALTAWVQKQYITPSLTYFLIGFTTTLIAILWLPDASWLLGPISFCYAVSGAGILGWRQILPLRTTRIFFGAVLLSVLLFSVPVFFLPQPTNSMTSIDAQSIFQYEQQGYGIATLPPWQPVPIAHEPTLPMSLTLQNGYLANDINRFGGSDRRQLQSLTTLLSNGTHEQTYQIRSFASQLVEVQQAYYPGWEAYLEGQALPISRRANNGLLEISLPEIRTTSTLTILLGSTTTRTAAWLLAAVALILAILLLRRRLRQAGPRRYYDDALLNADDRRMASLVIILFLGLVALANAPNNLLPLRASPNYTLQGAIRMDNRTDVGLDAIAARLSKTVVSPGDSLTVTTYWRSSRFLTGNYQRRLILRDVTSGNTPWQSPMTSLSSIPTRRWIRGRTVADTAEVAIPAGLAPGRYILSMEIQECTNDVCSDIDALTFFDRAGSILGSQLTVPQVITVE